MVSRPKSFDQVWKEVLDILSGRRSVTTLVQRIKNDIISVDYKQIKLRSKKTGRTRAVPRWQFELVWNSLLSSGSYVSQKHRPYIHSQIICAIFALLDNIEVKYDPLTLRLK